VFRKKDVRDGDGIVSHGSRRQRFQAILVMQPGQYWDGDDAVAIGDLMPGLTCEPIERHVGNAWTEAGVWSTMVVVKHPFLQDGPEMPFIQQDQPIQALATDRADQALAKRIRLRTAHGRFQHRQARRLNRAVDGKGNRCCRGRE
jgi:hypothetical protein